MNVYLFTLKYRRLYRVINVQYVYPDWHQSQNVDISVSPAVDSFFNVWIPRAFDFVIDRVYVNISIFMICYDL